MAYVRAPGEASNRRRCAVAAAHPSVSSALRTSSRTDSGAQSSRAIESYSERILSLP
jgi:hypothetical protein